MKVIEGIPVSPGIAIAEAFVLAPTHIWAPERPIAEGEVDRERERFETARQASIEELNRVYAEAEAEMGPEAAKIFLFHIGMLKDPALAGPIAEMIGERQVVAEYAVAAVLDQVAQRFRAKADSAFTTKDDDIRDLAERLIGHLTGQRRLALADLSRNTIVIAGDLTPSQTAGFDRQHVKGFATDVGGRTGHTAIVAAALGLPAVVGCEEVTDFARDGQTVILDGGRGRVILDPDEQTLADYTAQAETRRKFQISLAEGAAQPAVTRDGVHIEIVGNIEFPEEIGDVVTRGGEGVGLYRTEFLYLANDTEPTEEDHFEAYSRCVRLLEGRTLTVRTVDLGADKYTQSRTMVPERNPFLGLRSVRYALAHPEMLKLQVRAILRASTIGPVKIMFPLVTTIAELRHARLLLRDVMEDMDERGEPFDRHVPIGIMVEVPSAALMAEVFAAEVDFFSIGTNDLVQYTLAVDRTNERVAGLYQPAHPAVLKLIRNVTRAAKKYSLPVSCCGEAAGDPGYALLLLGLGLRTLSVTSGSIPRLKRFVREVTIPQCERVARKALTFDSAVQAAAFLRDQTRNMLPEAFFDPADER